MTPFAAVRSAAAARALAGAARACAVAAVLACALATAAAAQEPSTTTNADTSSAKGLLAQLGAAADTAQAALSDSLEPITPDEEQAQQQEFHPTWSTRYALNRQHTDWSQNLAFVLPLGRLKIDHRSNGTISRDAGTVSQTRTERLDSSTSLSYKAADKLNFHAAWVIPKNSYADNGGSNREDKSNVTVGGDYRFERTGSYDLNMKAEGGRAQTDTRQTQRDPERPDAPFRVDTPHASGLTGTLHGEGNLYRGTLFKLNSKYDYTRERLDNRTRVAWSDSAGHVVDFSDTTETINNRSRANSLETTLTPWRRTEFTVALVDDSRQDQYYLSLYKGQETHTYAHRSITSTNALTDGPLKGNVTLTWGHVDDAHTHISNTDVKKTTKRYDIRLESWRPWGFTLTGDLANEKSDEDHPELRPTDTSLDGTRSTHSLDFTLDRSLGQAFNLHGATNLSLQREEYKNPRNDRDVAVQHVSLGGAWAVNKKISLGASYDANKRNDVAIDKTRSGNNSTKTTYLFTPTLTYKVTTNTTVSQSLQFKSDYSVYNFFENRNFYNGSTTVTTSLTSGLSPRIKVDMTHSAIVLRKGGYAPVIVNQIDYGRLFRETNEDRSQELRASLNYKIGLLTFSMAQRIYFLHAYSNCKPEYGQFFCVYDQKSSRRQLSMTPQGVITYAFRGGAKLTVDVTRNELAGTTEKPYWRIDSSLTKVFFK